MDHPRTQARRAVAALALATTGALGAVLLTLPTAAVAAPQGPRVDRQEETGLVGFIGHPAGRPIAAAQPGRPASVAADFLRSNGRALGLDGRRDSLAVIEQHRSSTGGTTVRLRQVHEGLPVMGGEFAVNLDQDGAVLSVLGEASPVGHLTTDPAVSSRAATRSALARVSRGVGVGVDRLDATAPELVYYDPRLLDAPGPIQAARLSWLLEVRATRPAVAHTVVVDAQTGIVVLDFSSLAEARDRVVCDANNTSAQYPCTSPVWTETSQPGGADADVVAAFEYSGDTYDFLASRFGRDSLDDDGMTLVSTADYCDPGSSCPYQNAFWDGSQMVYGDGFAAADDVVGHELAHGVTDFSSSLFYYRQSGAINESMSDILGELIDLTNGSGNDSPAVRWLMGEDIPGIGAIRDMQDPPAYGQPDRMGSPLYFGHEDDSGGVHYNSGVSNKAAYLLVDGDTFNGRTVSPIGLDRTARLFYTVNNDLLVSGSDFADLANGMRQACAALAASGTDGFTSAHCTQVENAILATEMDSVPANAPTREARPCPSGRTPSTVLHDDLEDPTGQFTVMSVVGQEVWSYPQNPNEFPGFDATFATSGETNIWGYNRDGISDSALRMTTPVVVPEDAFLHFNHAFGFENDSFGTYDGGVVEYSTTGANGPWVDAGALFSAADAANGYTGTIDVNYGNPLGGRSAFVSESHGYGASRADLATLAGQSVMFRWRIGTDSIFDDYGWFIDDISVVRCLAADTTPPDTTITAGPANGSTTNTSSVTFQFSSTEPGSTFQCKLDDQGPAPCTSPHQLTGLTNGSHVFSVLAIDAAGNHDPSPATRTFTVAVPTPDTTPPDTTITKHPKKKTTKRKSTFAFTSTEPGTFACKLDKAAWAPCASPEKFRVSRGKHTLKVRSIDTSDNTDPSPAVWKWKVKKRRG